MGACSGDDNTVTPTTTANYYPTTTGSYWVYEDHAIDTNGTQSTEVMSTDSTYAGGQKTVGDKVANEFMTRTVSEFGDTTTSSYSYSEDSQIYSYINAAEFSPLGGEAASMWVKTADFKATTEWTALTQELPAIEVPAELTGGFAVSVTPKYTMKGKKGTMQAVTFEGKSMQAQEIISTTSVTLDKIKLSGFPTGQSVSFDVINKSYFVENIGMVKSVTEPYSFSFPGIGTMKQEGNAQILVRHSIK
ncbi:MAG: hypothetical protein V4642_03875 [Bacteroidota bacterium]